MIARLVILLSAIAVCCVSAGQPLSPSSSLLCQDSAPDQLLLDRLSLCRALAYPFCVNRGDSLSTELAQLAVELDSQLVARYEDVAAAQSQRCVYAWVNMVCSETFKFAGATSTAVCADVCAELAEHCVGLPCSPAADGADGPNCTNYRRIGDVAAAQCVLRGELGPGGSGGPAPFSSAPAVRLGRARFVLGLVAGLLVAGSANAR